METSYFAAGPPEQVVETPIPLGWGYNTDLGTHTIGSCWDLPASPNESSYAVVQNIDSVMATHRWSSSKSEALSELHVELDADADFGLVSGDFSAAYDATKNSTNASELLTIKVFIRSVNVDLELPSKLNNNRRTGTYQNSMEMDAFLNACGDRYLAAQSYGGYLIFVAGTSKLTEKLRQEISAQLKVDYSIGNGNLAAYASTLNDLEDKDVEFRVISRGFTQLLNLSGNPLDTVSPSDVLTQLATLRQNWVQSAIQGDFPSADYGVVVDQAMHRYTNNTTLYETCTQSTPPAALSLCFEGLMNKTQGKLHDYNRWIQTINTALNNMGDYYWGASTNSANHNKAEYQRVADLLATCEQNITTVVGECSAAARAPGADSSATCLSCNMGEVPWNCEPDDKHPDKCAESNDPRTKCDYNNLKAEVRGLSDEVMPLADLPNNGQMARMVSATQHTPSQNVGSTFTELCTLGGISGELASTTESVKLKKGSLGVWSFNISSQRTGITHTLRGQVWCTLQSFFFDGIQNSWRTYPTIMADKNNNNVEFRTSSNDVVPAKYARALNGVSGNFAGGAEWGKITEDNKLKVGSHQGQMRAWGTAFGLTNPAGGVIDHGLRSGPSVGISTNDKPDKYLAKKRLISTSDGICYLQQVGGQFDGKDEAVKIYSEDGIWTLAVSSICKNLSGFDYFSNGPCVLRKTIKATASCYLYDQTH